MVHAQCANHSLDSLSLPTRADIAGFPKLDSCQAQRMRNAEILQWPAFQEIGACALCGEFPNELPQVGVVGLLLETQGSHVVVVRGELH
jgi:hypothetical protein